MTCTACKTEFTQDPQFPIELCDSCWYDWLDHVLVMDYEDWHKTRRSDV